MAYLSNQPEMTAISLASKFLPFNSPSPFPVPPYTLNSSQWHLPSLATIRFAFKNSIIQPHFRFNPFSTQAKNSAAPESFTSNRAYQKTQNLF
jgi:hypothetical protein